MSTAPFDLDKTVQEIRGYLFQSELPDRPFAAVNAMLNEILDLRAKLAATPAHPVAEAERMVTALKLAKDALYHEVPVCCWATGPLTGDPIEDLIVCPGCRALNAIDTALAQAPTRTQGEGE